MKGRYAILETAGRVFLQHVFFQAGLVLDLPLVFALPLIFLVRLFQQRKAVTFGIVQIHVVVDNGARDAKLLPPLLRPNSLAQILACEMRTSRVVFAPLFRLLAIRCLLEYRHQALIIQPAVIRPSLRQLPWQIVIYRERRSGIRIVIIAWQKVQNEDHSDEPYKQRDGQDEGADGAEAVMRVSVAVGTRLDDGDQGRAFVAHLFVVISLATERHYKWNVAEWCATCDVWGSSSWSRAWVGESELPWRHMGPKRHQRIT